VFAIALGLCVGAAGALSVDYLFALADAARRDGARPQYLRVYFMGAPLIYGYFAIDAAFRAAGDTRTPFTLLLVSTACTLVLDPVLILGSGARGSGSWGGDCTRADPGGAFVAGLVLLSRRGLMRVGWVTWPTVRPLPESVSRPH
jgi:hypothetical protein